MAGQVDIGQVTSVVTPFDPRVDVGQISSTVTAVTVDPRVDVGQIMSTIVPSSATQPSLQVKTSTGWKPATMFIKKSTGWAPVVLNLKTASGWKALNSAPINTGKPSLTNTGPRIPLQPYANQFGAINSSNQLVLTTPNITVQGFDIPAQVIVKAAGVKVLDNFIHPTRVPAFGANTALVDCNGAPFGALTEVAYNNGWPETPNPWYNFVIGHDVWSHHNQSKWVADHYGVYNNNTGTDPATGITYKAGPTNVIIEYNFMWASSLFITGSDTSDGATHNDGVQMQGGTGTIVRFNTIYALLAGGVASDGTVMPTWSGWGSNNDPNNWSRTTTTVTPPWQYVTTSGLQVTCNVSAVTGSLFEGNWIYGGGNGISLANGAFGANYNVGTIKGNKFDHAQGLPTGHSATSETTYCIGKATGATYTDGGGNVYEDTGHAASVR
jgi:hypothetical protein